MRPLSPSRPGDFERTITAVLQQRTSYSAVIVPLLSLRLVGSAVIDDETALHAHAVHFAAVVDGDGFRAAAHVVCVDADAVTTAPRLVHRTPPHESNLFREFQVSARNTRRYFTPHLRTRVPLYCKQ